MTPREAIARLQRTRDALAEPLAFYQAHAEDWHVLARDVVRQTLANLRPPDAGAEDWTLRAEAAAARVSARLVTRAPVGIVLRLANLGRGLAEDATPGAREAYARHPVTVDEVERWVAAGRDKESEEMPGKNLDQRDAGESDTQIAWKVINAINQDKPGAEGLMAAVAAFLSHEAGDLPAEVYPQILHAWTAVFGSRAAEDWRTWVHRAVTA